MSLRIDPALNSPAPAPAPLKKFESHVVERDNKKSLKPDSNAKHITKNSSNKVDDKLTKIAQKNVDKAAEEITNDDDLLFSAELEKQMESDEIASLQLLDNENEEVAIPTKKMLVVLPVLAEVEVIELPESELSEVPNTTNVTNSTNVTNFKNTNTSALEALLSGKTNLNTEVSTLDPAFSSSGEVLIPVVALDGEIGEDTVKIKEAQLGDAKASSSKLIDNENVVDLFNQKRVVKNAGQTNSYANQNPKSILEKVIKDVKAKPVTGEMTSEQAKMMKNIDALTDADKMVKLVGGEKNLDNKSQLNTKTTDKVFDLSKIKSSNATEIINQISDYIIQNKTATKSNVELAVNHADLGRININVSKLNPEQVNIQIMTSTPEGKQFFAENSRGLLSHLSNNGVNVADLKLDSSASSSNNSNKNSDSSESFSQNPRGQFGQNQAEDNNRRQDSKRREELWDLYRRNAA